MIVWGACSKHENNARHHHINAGKLATTSDLGTQTCSYILSDRIRSIVEMLGAASCALVWERPGEGDPNATDLSWANAFARQLRENGVFLRAQYLLHEKSVCEIAL